jgi:hypothetical protein
VRITAASSPAEAIPCVDVNVDRNSSNTTFETRTPWDWVIRLPPLNFCVDAAFTASGFLLLPLLCATFSKRKFQSCKLRSNAFQLSSKLSPAAGTHTQGLRLWPKAAAMMIGSRFFVCVFALLWVWASVGASASRAP